MSCGDHWARVKLKATENRDPRARSWPDPFTIAPGNLTMTSRSCPPIQKTSNRVVRLLRPERGYSVTIYDRSPVTCPRSLAAQIGQKYDRGKVRNSYLAEPAPAPICTTYRSDPDPTPTFRLDPTIQTA